MVLSLSLAMPLEKGHRSVKEVEVEGSGMGPQLSMRGSSKLRWSTSKREISSGEHSARSLIHSLTPVSSRYFQMGLGTPWCTMDY